MVRPLKSRNGWIVRKRPSAGKEFQQEVALFGQCTCPSGLEIPRVVPHEERDSKRSGRFESTHSDMYVTPASRPIGNEVSSDPVMQLENQGFIQRVPKKHTFKHICLQSGHAIG